MSARNYRAQVVRNEFVPGGTCLLRLRPQTLFRFEAGQFLSVRIPSSVEAEGYYWRPYSFANSYEDALSGGIDLCIRPTSGGESEAYLKSLKPGDWLQIRGPYGDFTLTTPAERGVCFIATGTGIAPFRSMVQSKEFAQKSYGLVHAILGFRRMDEVPFIGELEKCKVRTVYALSQERRANTDHSTFNGRVTDCLQALPPDYPWTEVDFYLCGNGAMIQEVRKILVAKGVSEDAIHFESFSAPVAAKKVG